MNSWSLCNSSPPPPPSYFQSSRVSDLFPHDSEQISNYCTGRHTRCNVETHFRPSNVSTALAHWLVCKSRRLVSFHFGRSTPHPIPFTISLRPRDQPTTILLIRVRSCAVPGPRRAGVQSTVGLHAAHHCRVGGETTMPAVGAAVAVVARGLRT